MGGCICEGALDQELHLQREGGRQRRKVSEDENWRGASGKESEKTTQLFVPEDSAVFSMGEWVVLEG